ncbi:single-stranded DNA-binding protein 3 isoform X6 [Ictalurus punctatus]|uniref:Single-stranded DNA-binding protein 3 isoform X6 n=1 Tax=Ictalurus punctatus TaxID=7998 RepID=A0A979EXX6_ICTPU|nr:single-stranded DNA-binding protein 3 isoform X6 [Ictalurus punctatus]
MNIITSLWFGLVVLALLGTTAEVMLVTVADFRTQVTVVQSDGVLLTSHPNNRRNEDGGRSAAAAPSPVMGNMPPNDGMPGGPMPPGFFQPFMSPRYPGGPRPSLRMPNQPPVGVPGSQPLLPNNLDPTRPQGHPSMGGPMRMNPPRGMGSMGPQNYGAMRPPPNSLGGPGMPGMNMGPGGRGPWPNPNTNSIAYSSSSPGNYVGPPGGGGPPGTPIMPSPGDSTNSSENIYTMMNPIGPGGNRPNFPMGPGPDGPMGGMGSMEPHHMNGSLGSGDMDGLPKVNNFKNLSLTHKFIHAGHPRQKHLHDRSLSRVSRRGRPPFFFCKRD